MPGIFMASHEQEMRFTAGATTRLPEQRQAICAVSAACRAAAKEKYRRGRLPYLFAPKCHIDILPAAIMPTNDGRVLAARAENCDRNDESGHAVGRFESMREIPRALLSCCAKQRRRGFATERF